MDLLFLLLLFCFIDSCFSSFTSCDSCSFCSVIDVDATLTASADLSICLKNNATVTLNGSEIHSVYGSGTLQSSTNGNSLRISDTLDLFNDGVDCFGVLRLNGYASVLLGTPDKPFNRTSIRFTAQWPLDVGVDQSDVLMSAAKVSVIGVTISVFVDRLVNLTTNTANPFQFVADRNYYQSTTVSVSDCVRITAGKLVFSKFDDEAIQSAVPTDIVGDGRASLSGCSGLKSLLGCRQPKDNMSKVGPAGPEPATGVVAQSSRTVWIVVGVVVAVVILTVVGGITAVRVRQCATSDARNGVE